MRRKIGKNNLNRQEFPVKPGMMCSKSMIRTAENDLVSLKWRRMMSFTFFFCLVLSILFKNILRSVVDRPVASTAGNLERRESGSGVGVSEKENPLVNVNINQPNLEEVTYWNIGANLHFYTFIRRPRPQSLLTLIG